MEFPLIIINILILMEIVTVSTAGIRKRCNLQFKCSLYEKTVWATDGKMCYIFRNNCYLSSENCQRINRCQHELREIEKEKCQKFCTRFCPALYKPICCHNNSNETRSFSNQCELGMHICKTGKTCIFTQPGRCNRDL